MYKVLNATVIVHLFFAVKFLDSSNMTMPKNDSTLELLYFGQLTSNVFIREVSWFRSAYSCICICTYCTYTCIYIWRLINVHIYMDVHRQIPFEILNCIFVGTEVWWCIKINWISAEFRSQKFKSPLSARKGLWTYFALNCNCRTLHVLYTVL